MKSKCKHISNFFRKFQRYVRKKGNYRLSLWSPLAAIRATEFNAQCTLPIVMQFAYIRSHGTLYLIFLKRTYRINLV
jgi:hypothetical protein